ncbi:MAG TPA: hypothetical protein VIJ52_05535 [Pseudolabrys sp.]
MDGGDAHPPWVAEAMRRIRIDGIRPEHESILIRLTTDPRMNAVWAQLTRRDRTDPTRFLYSAVRRPGDPELDTEQAQHHAMGATLHFAFSTVRDKMAVSKLEESEKLREQTLNVATIVWDVAGKLPEYVSKFPEIAAETLPGNPQTIEAIRRTSIFLMRVADLIRGADDPMTNVNSHGDPLARGIQTNMASLFKERFGSRLDGLAAIVTAVVLSLVEIPDAAISRSAHLRVEQAQKNGVQQAKIV